MSEEIITDGVNVAECDAYKDKHCMDKTSIMFCNLNICSNFPNCYYKQLKRMQAENEELKKIIETQNPWHNCNNCNKDYKQALEEIREIASAIINGKHITNDIEGHLKELSKQIIEKTNEVLK